MKILNRHLKSFVPWLCEKPPKRAVAFRASTATEDTDMEFRNIRALRGPSTWAKCTALEVAVDLGEMKFPVREIPGFETRLRDWLPACCQPATSAREKPEPAPGSLAPGSLTLAHVLERVV